MRVPVALAFAAGCATLPAEQRAVERTPPRIILASGVVDDTPVDEIDVLRAEHPKLCVFVRWFDLPLRPIPYRVELRDGVGRLAHLWEAPIHPKKATWNTWNCLRPTPADAPGNWTYLVRLGAATFEGSVRVEQRSRPLGVLSVRATTGAAGALADVFARARQAGGPIPWEAFTECMRLQRQAAATAKVSFDLRTDGRLAGALAEGGGPLPGCLAEAARAAPPEPTPPIPPPPAPEAPSTVPGAEPP